MKKIPFDMELAKAGSKLVTREGKPARIVAYDIRGRGGETLAAAIMDECGTEVLCPLFADGMFFDDGDEHHCDLFILREPQVLWLCRDPDGYLSDFFSLRENAELHCKRKGVGEVVRFMEVEDE